MSVTSSRQNVTKPKLLLDGEWIETDDSAEVRSPYSGELLARVPRATAEHAREAVDAAARAMANPLPAHERAAILDRVAGLIAECETALAKTVSAEAGKPLKLARDEVRRASGTYTAAAVEARKLVGSMVPMDAAEAGVGKLAFTLRVPVGVVAAITPFNFPVNLVAHKIAPALAAGCAVVLKPAAQTPLSALALAELEVEAGLPPGWLNVLTGPAAELADALIADDRVGLVTFTGSAEVGWELRRRAPHKRVALELGNSTPVLVEPDADLETAVTKIAASAFGFAGQACISVQRILVANEIYDEFVRSFLPKVAALKVGDPSDESVDVGPVIDLAARDRVMAWIDEAKAGGAQVLIGGSADGPVVMPTVLADVDPEMKVFCKEVFAPLVTVTRYASLEQGLELANATEYGLQAGIFTRDLTAALTAARGLQFGGVLINETPTFRVDHMPYGGTKASGNTKEGPAYAVHEMTEERLVVIQT